MIGLGPIQRRIWREFIARPDAELSTSELVVQSHQGKACLIGIQVSGKL